MTTQRATGSRELAMQTSDHLEEPVVEGLETSTINRIYWAAVETRPLKARGKDIRN